MLKYFQNIFFLHKGGPWVITHSSHVILGQ